MEFYDNEKNAVLISVNGHFIKVWKDDKKKETIEDFICKANDIATYANEYDYNYATTFLAMIEEVFQVQTEIVKIETFLDID